MLIERFKQGISQFLTKQKERYCSTYELYFPSEYATDEPKRETNMNSFNINEFYMTRCLQCTYADVHVVALFIDMEVYRNDDSASI